jgi:hypothetical protein
LNFPDELFKLEDKEEYASKYRNYVGRPLSDHRARIQCLQMLMEKQKRKDETTQHYVEEKTFVLKRSLQTTQRVFTFFLKDFC